MRNPLSSFSRVAAIAGVLVGMTIARSGARADQIPARSSGEQQRVTSDDKQAQQAQPADRSGKPSLWPLRISYVNTGLTSSVRLYDASGKLDDQAAAQLDELLCD